MQLVSPVFIVIKVEDVMQSILFLLRVQMIAASVQCIIGAKTALWFVVHMYGRHAALFSSTSGVQPCTFHG
jgi:hypothetical protein